MRNNTLQLQIAGSRLVTILSRRIGELENEVGEISRREDALRAAGAASQGIPRYRGIRDIKEITRQMSALRIVVDNLEPSTIYPVSLADLIMLDLMDAAFNMNG